MSAPKPRWPPTALVTSSSVMFDFTFVAPDDGVNVLAHPLEQLVARRAWAVVGTQATAESAAPKTICRRRVRVRGGGGRGIDWRRIRPGEDPVRRLAVPHERVPDELHVVAQTKVHEGIGRREVVTVLAFARMNHLPLEIVFRGDLVELLLDERDVLRVLFRASAKRSAACDHAPVHSRAHEKVILEDLLQ